MHTALLFLLLLQAPLETDPVEIVTGTAFDLYRSLISPSQGDVCNFTPSCSRYASEAITKHGIFWGGLMASDRLLRCNPYAYHSFGKHYLEIRNMKFYDPVTNNYMLHPLIKRAEHARDGKIPSDTSSGERP